MASTEAAAAEPPQGAAFVGRWLLDRIDGDMDAFAADMGASWMQRSVGKKMGWGAGKVKHSFAFGGGRVTITGESPKGTFVQDLPLDGVRHATVALSGGEPIQAAARLEGRFLHLDTDLFTSRREVVGEEIVFEQTSGRRKVCCKLIFKRA